jgi:hypothetical protein
MPTKNTNLPPFLSLHSIAATRGDGLRPELLALFKRLAAGVDNNLAEFAALPVRGNSDVRKSDGKRKQSGLSAYDLPVLQSNKMPLALKSAVRKVCHF